MSLIYSFSGTQVNSMNTGITTSKHKVDWNRRVIKHCSRTEGKKNAVNDCQVRIKEEHCQLLGSSTRSVSRFIGHAYGIRLLRSSSRVRFGCDAVLRVSVVLLGSQKLSICPSNISKSNQLRK